MIQECSVCQRILREVFIINATKSHLNNDMIPLLPADFIQQD